MNVYKLIGSSSSSPPRIKISLDGDTLTFITDRYTPDPNTGEAIYEEAGQTTVSVGALLARPDCADYSVYVVDLNAAPLTNMLAVTLPAKMSIQTYAKMYGLAVCAGICVPSKADPSSVFVYIPSYCAQTTEVVGDLALSDSSCTSVFELMPTLVLSHLATTDSIFNVRVECSQAINATVYLETSVGVLLTPRIELVDGVGLGYVSLAGLPAGQTGKIKAGFKYFSGLAETSFTV